MYTERQNKLNFQTTILKTKISNYYHSPKLKLKVKNTINRGSFEQVPSFKQNKNISVSKISM